jgi:hypothetical protein
MSTACHAHGRPEATNHLFLVLVHRVAGVLTGSTPIGERPPASAENISCATVSTYHSVMPADAKFEQLSQVQMFSAEAAELVTV